MGYLLLGAIVQSSPCQMELEVHIRAGGIFMTAQGRDVEKHKRVPSTKPPELQPPTKLDQKVSMLVIC